MHRHGIHAEAIDIDSFVVREDKNKPLLVCCYHGISGQSAAKFLAANGFTRIYSSGGGCAVWSGLDGRMSLTFYRSG